MKKMYLRSSVLCLILSMTCVLNAVAQDTDSAMDQVVEIQFDSVDEQGLRTVATVGYIDWGYPYDSPSDYPIVSIATAGTMENGDTDSKTILSLTWINDAPFIFLANGYTLFSCQMELSLN